MIPPFLIAKKLADEELDSLFNKFLELRNPVISPEIDKPIKYDEDYEKCGLELVNSLVFNFEQLTDEQQLLLRPLLQRPVTTTSIITPGGYFKVHYDETGPNSPGYDINLLADALDSTYRYEIEFLGYTFPPGDSAVNPGQPSNDYGGDNRYDVYIGNLGGGVYGYTQFETEVEPGSSRYTSYMHIDNDFVGYYTTGINAARVTVAHEFHHAIQGGNYIFRDEDSYFYEITSTAMEEFVFDDVNDYYAYIPTYFNNPETPLPSTNGYSTATWNIFLQQHFNDYNIIKRQWELMPSTRAMNAISISLFEYESSFAREFNRYAIWMYFTNYRSIPGSYFEEAENYPLVQPTVVVQFTPPSKHLDMSSKAAAQSFINFFVPGSNDSLIAIVTNGDVQSAINESGNIFDFEYTLYSDSSSGDRYLTPNYSSDFVANNPSFWSVSEILNNLVVREDDNTITPSQNKFEYAYPSPFYYNKSYLFGSSIFIPYNADLGEPVNFNVYTSAMELVYRNNETIKFLPDEQVGVIWNVTDNNSVKLASGVYIYVVQNGDDVVKGKVVIFN